MGQQQSTKNSPRYESETVAREDFDKIKGGDTDLLNSFVKKEEEEERNKEKDGSTSISGSLSSIMADLFHDGISKTDVVVWSRIFTILDTSRVIPKGNLLSPEVVTKARQIMNFAHACYGWRYVSLLHKSGSILITMARSDETKEEKDWKWFFHHSHITKDDVINANFHAKPYYPAHVLCLDNPNQRIMVCIRGSLDVGDIISDVDCKYAPFLNGKAHRGMLTSANNKLAELENIILDAMKTYPQYELIFTGHSLGAGVSSLLAMLWKEKHKTENMSYWGFGVPAVVDSTIALTTSTYCHSFINRYDIVSRLSFGSLSDFQQKIKLLKSKISNSHIAWMLFCAENNLTKPINKTLLKSGLTLEDLRALETNEKLYPPGVIGLFLWEAKKAWCEWADPSTFNAIPFCSGFSMYSDHWMAGYESGADSHLITLKEIESKPLNSSFFADKAHFKLRVIKHEDILKTLKAEIDKGTSETEIYFKLIALLSEMRKNWENQQALLIEFSEQLKYLTVNNSVYTTSTLFEKLAYTGFYNGSYYDSLMTGISQIKEDTEVSIKDAIKIQEELFVDQTSTEEKYYNVKSYISSVGEDKMKETKEASKKFKTDKITDINQKQDKLIKKLNDDRDGRVDSLTRLFQQNLNIIEDYHQQSAIEINNWKNNNNPDTTNNIIKEDKDEKIN